LQIGKSVKLFEFCKPARCKLALTTIYSGMYINLRENMGFLVSTIADKKKKIEYLSKSKKLELYNRYKKNFKQKFLT
jgi:hypothetical protein